jgi:hypothetical protein
MSAEPSHQVPLSGPTYHALQFVARIDQIAVEQIVETLMATYLETRLRAIPTPRHSTGRDHLSGCDRSRSVERRRRWCPEHPQSEKREDKAQAQRFPAMTLPCK